MNEAQQTQLQQLLNLAGGEDLVTYLLKQQAENEKRNAEKDRQLHRALKELDAKRQEVRVQTVRNRDMARISRAAWKNILATPIDFTKLRKPQAEGLNSVLDAVRAGHKRISVALPTGTGKVLDLVTACREYPD